MFPSFIGILDIQSWWEVPCIAYFCSLFRTAFNLLDFDIEELEEALLTDGTEETASSLLTELIVRLLNGCLGNNDISAFNYQMYLRRLFRQKCQDTGRYNPFNTDIDFQFLPLRTKVEILYALCDFRLDANDVFDLFKNLEAESLRVEPLGCDDNESAYWYFYGTRLYREDIVKKPKGKNKKKKPKKRGWFYGDDWLDDNETERVWQVVCFTEEDWAHLTEKFSKATSKVEKELYRSLSQNFLPEIPRLFQERERLQRKRLLELAPRRTSSRVLQKIKQKEEEVKESSQSRRKAPETVVTEENKQSSDLARQNRAKRRNLLRTQSTSSDSGDSASEKEEMPQKIIKKPKVQEKRSKNSSATQKGEPPPEPPTIKTGRKTNNSLASATGQIVIPENDEPVNSTRRKLKTSQIFSQTEEDIQTDMYKVLEQLTLHDDAWPFMDPVEEEYAPNYYAVIRRPMDLHKMEERLDTGYYTDFSLFKDDFKLIVNNCRLYNGQDNEYTVMVDNLQAAFNRLTEKYINRYSSSDEEIAVEFQLPTPSRKHKRKASESPTRHKRKKRKSNSGAGEPQSSTSEQTLEKTHEKDVPKAEVKKPKESHKRKLNKEKGKDKKKRKGHHHHKHGKHSKSHHRKKDSHKSAHSESSKNKHNKKPKHDKNRDKKSKRKKNKHHDEERKESEVLKKSESYESLESSNRSRSASPLPSIHTPSPSPTELDVTPRPEPPTVEEYKDKFDMIKERRRAAAKDAFESLFEHKNKSSEKQKQQVHVPEKDKHQKLRETIEKLKAKNEKYKASSLFNNMFAAGHSGINKTSQKANESCVVKDPMVKDKYEENHSNEDNEEIKETTSGKGKSNNKSKPKKTSAKNESASEALEQAVKDISKWLDDPPKGSAASSPCDSPALTISTEDQDNSHLDDDISQGEKPLSVRKELIRKRPSSREPKFLKRREIQRTIDRLQPGKSKGNLLTNIANKNVEKAEEPAPLAKARDFSKGEDSPKLSLGSVLPTVEFTLGSDHNFCDDNKIEKTEEGQKDVIVAEVKNEEKVEEKRITNDACKEVTAQDDKKDTKVEDSISLMKPSQEKATPNLSAWFKAFGAPKTPSATVTSSTIKKKVDEQEYEEKGDTTIETKIGSPKNPPKYDSPTDPDTPNPDGGDSPLPNVSNTPRQRRTSTGSSISERSSFSQDLDSPRHQMSHTSPLLRSPASPRTDDFQKITYPIINGTVRAGFYQDTTSIKSSPEKSSSPREGPQSPYSPYSPHVYATNNVMGSSTPNYFVDHNKSPLPTYNQNPLNFYDGTKTPIVNKPNRTNEDYTTFSPETFNQNVYGSGPYSPVHSEYPSTTMVQSSQPSPQMNISNTRTPPINTQTPLSDAKSLFPMKKRTYNEPELPTDDSGEIKDLKLNQKNDYQRQTQTLHPLSTPSVDDIALALSEKSDIAKMNSIRDKNKNDYTEHHLTEMRENQELERTGHLHESKKEISCVNTNKQTVNVNKDNIDMVNMGYMNPDQEKRFSIDSRPQEIEYTHREIPKSSLQHQQKGYEIDAIAINLGMSGQQLHKTATKTNFHLGSIPPAHTHERHNEINLNTNMAHAHQNQYNKIATGQSISNFSLNDIETANKKLYSCNTSNSTALDYGNWKMTNQIRKQDILPSDFSNNYNPSQAEKMKADVNASTSSVLNYKNIQQQQYNNYGNTPRPSLRAHDLQQSLPAELRIPNPRGHLKNDQMGMSTSLAESEAIAKNIDSLAKAKKTEKLVQNHPLVSSVYTPYNSHSTLPLDGLRSIPNIPQMLERYTDERYLSGFASSSSSLYHDKTFQMAQMFNKNLQPDHTPSTATNLYSQPSTASNKDTNIYKSSNITSAQMDTKYAAKNKRKRTSETRQPHTTSTQVYHTPSCGTDVLSSVKSTMMPGSSFNFGPTSNMGLTGSIYGDSSGFSIEDFRNSTNQLMAANYMAAAVAHQQQQQRSETESGVEKLAKPAHQNSSSSFPFLGTGQVRAGYAFADPSSPLYQQYFQRHQEELLRQTGAQIIGLYPPGYPPGLGARQPYDSINRPSWL